MEIIEHVFYPLFGSNLQTHDRKEWNAWSTSSRPEPTSDQTVLPGFSAFSDCCKSAPMNLKDLSQSDGGSYSDMRLHSLP